MKAEELMIGDWVKRKDDNKPCKVDGIISTDDACLLSTTNDNLGFDYMFDPIPLTPEILEKNGFTKITKKVYEFCTDDYRILWPTDNNNTLAINSFFAKYGILSKQNIDYVHQLQHALRLCGINKEIEL